MNDKKLTYCFGGTIVTILIAFITSLISINSRISVLEVEVLKYFKPPHHEFFKIECNAHDAAYDAGGDKQDRKNADIWLYQQMSLKTIGYANIFKPIKSTYLVLIALLYYISVRVCGRKYFNFIKDRNER